MKQQRQQGSMCSAVVGAMKADGKSFLLNMQILEQKQLQNLSVIR